MNNEARKKFHFNISIWVTISAIAVLATISAVMTLTHFQRQKDQAVELLVEKGATLIRSLEAGMRSQGREGLDVFSLRKLLLETAQQPDIDYIVITNSEGNIIADSDPSMIGQKYGLDLGREKIAMSRELKWRQAANSEGADTFEVFSGFFPQARYNANQTALLNNSKSQKSTNMIIYVGFNLEKIEKATAEDNKNTIMIALILLFIGSSAIFSLLLAQAYRTARTSLSRMTIFSEALIKNMPIGLIAQNEKGNIITCNEKAGSILNIDCKQITGRQVNSILPVPLQKIFTELSREGDVMEEDLQLASGRKENTILEIIATSLTDKGISTGKIMLLRDVTALRQLENEVAKSRHLTSLASLAAGVAHEIRNPLSSIKGFAVYFRERFSGNTEDQQMAQTMIAEVDRLNRVITQLIEFARPVEMKLQRAHFSDLIGHTLSLIAAEAKRNQVIITTDVPLDLPTVEVDPDKIKQVLLNIFLNSLAAMKNGGNLKIKVAPQKDNIAVIISDTGTGIAKMDLPRIYDPYFTSKPAGTGLGLAVVQKIMEAHGGTITVESTVDQGTGVELLFPQTATEQKDR